MAKRRDQRSFSPKYDLIALLTAVVIFSLVATRPAAALEPNKWTKVDTPTEGDGGNWVLASGSNIQHLTLGADGALYANAQGLTYTLYRSTNSGYHWAPIGNVIDNIVATATSPDDGRFLCYATTSTVYISKDGGKNFSALPASPGGAGSNNIEITSLAIARLNSHIIIVGTRDTGSAQFGGVYTLDTEPVIPAWVNSNIGSYDVYAVAAAPYFARERQFVAVVTDETNTFVTTKIGDAAWGAIVGNARLNKDNSGAAVVVTGSAAISFPDNYDADASSGDYVQFVAINTGTGNGDVYKIVGAEAPGASSATDLNIGAAYGQSNIDVTGLAVKGNAAGARLVAGAAASAQTYLSTDGGTSWKRGRLEPTGGSQTCVLMSPDGSTIYAATSGTESAFSTSPDGLIWNQVGLIDTTIDAVIDFAPSPTYEQDSTLFLLTFGGEHSLWRSSDGGTTWERTFSSNLTGVDSLAMLKLSPQYGTKSKVLFLTGTSNGSPTVWKSTDNGQNFTPYPAIDPVTSAEITIDTWVVMSDTELFIGSYDGSKGLVYLSTNSGFTYASGKQAGSQSLKSVALSPNYPKDGTMLAGNSNGWVYWSNDSGSSFKPLPADATSPPLNGIIYVAFDPDFGKNRTVYAASNTADKGVYRFVIGTSTAWERIDSTLPSGSRLNQLIAAPEGTLYAANAKTGSGMERSLNPTYSLGPSFETVNRGLGDNATLSGLWLCDSRLWSIDTTGNRLLTFGESLAAPPVLTAPAQGAPGVGTITNQTITNVILNWEAVSDATSYQWQLDHDTDFSSVPTGFEGTTQASMVRLPTLEPATTYYWRVRVSAPTTSPWSAKWSFTTSLAGEVVSLKPEYPAAGAREVPISPLFQWNAVIGAEAYELLVATDGNFTNPVVSRVGEYALSATAWQCNVNLEHETTYYWKVRAKSASTYSTWSAVSAFTTEPLPPPKETPVAPPPTPSLSPAPTPLPPEITLPFSKPLAFPAPVQPTLTSQPPNALMPVMPPLPPTPPPPPAPAIPTWLIYLIGGLLLSTMLLTITILVIVVAVIRRE